MKAFTVTAPGSYGLVESAVPMPGPGELLVAPAAVGICGSDLELLDGRRPAPYVRYPVVPGHEWSGTVVSVGPGVTGFEPGTPLVAEGVRGCATCPRCREGRGNLCAGPYAETGFTHPGALAERLVVPAALAYRLPSDRPLAPAALLEPAGCVASGLLELGVPAAGSRIAVVGDGPLGLLAVMLSALSSPQRLTLVGRRPERIRYAATCGATDATNDPDAAGLASSFDLVIEASNAAAGAVTALRLARRGGSVLLLGISGAAAPAVDPDLISLGQLRVQGAFAASAAAWRWMVSLYSAGLFDPSPLITHQFPLTEVKQGLAVLADRGSGALKVLIQPEPELA
ncbi:alcohol dehydrogenase catalytic domain-containing protein [Natronosporangium hydrolyticum]|uniref:Alcohol dehydrogenase catalytic domain-containing protein n=1 Tax=Natronosporangium hydrolyticum TaxID=2811111 RepID=A0A895YET0_9ACTN|nr:alcohol dehydrogenase catalytic domain-containing protein [Natronosporangium hydrolyticum]QSB12730.1 alcohol dehydrogenase catalytic domain-containing protein [Natronosporangium hydrolyticum]